MKIRGAVLICLIAVSCAKVFAGGFQINEHSAKAMAMGNAFTAIANDPSALYFNGAGITSLEGTQFLLGTSLIAPISSFRGVTPNSTNESKMVNQVFFPSHFYFTQKLNDKLAVGLGFNTPFGLGTKWDDGWVGKYLAIETTVMTFVFNPTVAYKIMDELSVSASLAYTFANVEITKKSSQAPFQGDALVKLEGKEKAAYGYQFGILYKPTEKLSVGASFHSQIKYKMEGTANSTGAQQLIDAGKLPVNANITADLTTPVNINFGVAYDVLPELKLSAEYQYVGWSSYDTLKVVFTDAKYEKMTNASARLYENSYILRFGADYKVNSDLSIQAGISYDKDPVKSDMLNPSLVDANRLGLAIGAHYIVSKNIAASLSYLFVRGEQLDAKNSTQDYSGRGLKSDGTPMAPFNGTYNSKAHCVALSLSYSL